MFYLYVSLVLINQLEGQILSPKEHIPMNEGFTAGKWSHHITQQYRYAIKNLHHNN